MTTDSTTKPFMAACELSHVTISTTHMLVLGRVQFFRESKKLGRAIQLCATIMAEGTVLVEKSLEGVHDKEVKCEGCTDSGDKAEAFCHQCAEFICKECVETHKITKLFASHELVSLEYLKQGRAREIAVKEPPTKKCHIHEEPLNIYCFDCDTLICHHCTTKVHRDHNLKFATPDNKKNLLEKLGPLKQVAANVSSAIENMQITKQEVEAKEDLVASAIHTSFDELHQILDKRENQLFLEALRKMQDNEAMSMHSDRSSMQGEEDEHSSKSGKIELAEEADMGVEVRCADDLQQLCQTNANITQLALDPAQWTVRGEGVETAEVHQTAEVTLTTKLINCKTEVVGQLKSLYDGSVVKGDVDQSGPGEYRIQYTPTVRGRHELTVSVDGQQVTGSPFPVFVFIHPTQLGKPVKVWGGITYDSGITTNSVGDVIVAEYEGDIVKLESKGKTSVLVKYSDSKLTQLGSVSTDDEDNIYCTDYMTNKVMKCNKNGGNVQVHEVRQVKGPGHWGVAVVGDEVMLCERDNKGTIMVYDRELKYVRRVEHSGLGEFTGVSADNHGNLYVTDYTNDCTQVFGNDGVFLRSFGHDSNGVKRLASSYYVCVSGHSVYVTNSGGHYVSVFTTAGDYVTSFGQHGHGEGEFIFPCGVCTDKDGFVYVADSDNNRVQCF